MSHATPVKKAGLGRRLSLARPVDPATNPLHQRRPTRLWRLLRFVAASSKAHAFLDRFWIAWLFALCPRKRRRDLALHLLSFSPHYWVYQWTGMYPPERTWEEVLEGEFHRNAASRRELSEKLLSRFFQPHMTVLDFGCGPGFLAKETSRRVARVVASDVSRGVIACAKQLNPAPNLTYVTNGVADLRRVPDASIDLIYSFAVLQHLCKRQTRAFAGEFARVLKPGGMGLCHTILRDPSQANEYNPKGWLQKRVMLRMVYYSESELRTMLAEAGFVDVQVRDVSTLADIHDDIGREQVVTFVRRPEG
jgi:ubiquinone/menaquinone biosynthesis C-methylase UbiE